jgi:Zinc finger, C2H2 type
MNSVYNIENKKPRGNPSPQGRIAGDLEEVPPQHICVFNRPPTTSNLAFIDQPYPTRPCFPQFSTVGAFKFGLEDGYLSPVSAISESSSPWSQPDSVSSQSSFERTLPQYLPAQEPGYFHSTPWVPHPPPLPARHPVLKLKTRSSDEGKHQCPVCERRFLRPSALKIHNRVHSRERPFACPVEGCNRSGAQNGFSVQSNLNRHLRTLHRDTVFARDLVGREEEDRGGRSRREIEWVPGTSVSPPQCVS